MLNIQLADHNDFLIEVLLDEQTYFLHFGWNSEWHQWEMGVENARNERIIEGIPINPLTDILESYRRLPVPQGAFLVITNSKDALNRQSFVTGLATLVYITEQELLNANGDAIQALL